MTFDSARLAAAYAQARRDLFRLRQTSGHWVGELSTSALSTATAVSALSLMRRHAHVPAGTASQQSAIDYRGWIDGGVKWLVAHQREDGGWGDTPRSYSNISTTWLVLSAVQLAGRASEFTAAVQRGERYVAEQGAVAGLRRRYGKDKTFAVPILANAALAGCVPWQDVAALPFELACFPQSFYRFLQLPVVSYAIPALVAIGQAKFYHDPPRNPVLRAIRRKAIDRSLNVLQRMQPASGGYLEAIPLTSFVVMSLAASEKAEHPVARHGLQFLIDTVRADGSWPIDTNLATWNTTLALNGLLAAGEAPPEPAVLEWLLACQNRSPHPFTGAAPGGWGWSDLSGAVPDADDTPGALLTLAACAADARVSSADRARLDAAAEPGCRWLLDLQNRDGGWPTFCRGWGKLPFDRSGADLTAHAMRALHAWQRRAETAFPCRGTGPVWRRCAQALARGERFLERSQHADGSWTPLWFGNQDHPEELNPVYGTAKVLLAYLDRDRGNLPAAQRGLAWLRSVQQPDGGWSGAVGACDRAPRQTPISTVEETALAVETMCRSGPEADPAVAQGLDWLIRAVETNRHLEPAPIGFYFAKLWYYEQLYPAIFTVAALGQGVRRMAARPTPPVLTRLA